MVLLQRCYNVEENHERQEELEELPHVTIQDAIETLRNLKLYE